MKIALAKYMCGHCHGSFEAPMLDESSYGEFLLWSSAGNVAYMNAFKDKAYMEVKSILTQCSDDLKADPFKASEVLQSIFGPMACDPDPAGAPYVVGAQPPCSVCKNGQVETWEMIDPPKIVERDIPSVTHVGWDRLNNSEKVELVERFIVEAGFGVKAR